MQRPIEVPIGSPVQEIDTPALLVDIERLEANIEALDVPVRVGAWVHGTPAIAHMQLESEDARGIVVRGVAEAEVFAAAGCTDIRILRPLVTANAQSRAAALARSIRIVTEDDGLPLWEEEPLVGAVTVSARVASTPEPSATGSARGLPSLEEPSATGSARGLPSLEEPDRAIHDCGQKAIGRDFGAPSIKGREDLIANASSAEHGIVVARSGAQPYRIGDWLELVPGDIATAFALHDFAWGVRGGVLDAVWPVSARGAFQ